ncbi:uncharacterized protein [Drosophila tropicalis]|uniref:uncharacterized protein n=1 Tax=Drosophila tropicalis TaxID=46794 RepID=UPI0035ABE70B
MRHRRQLSEAFEAQLKPHHHEQQEMGNVMDRNMSFDSGSVATLEPHMDELEDEEKENQEPQEQAVPKQAPNLMFHVYSYRQQLSCKKHHVMKMATSKLMLTEELLKLQPIKHKISSHSATSLEDYYEIPLLSDDEMDDNDVEKQDNGDLLVTELTNLKNYRKELRSIILDVATEKFKKSSNSKKKLKRLKRRTLISSKKPSKKNKNKSYCGDWNQQLEEPQYEQDETESAEVIIID